MKRVFGPLTEDELKLRIKDSFPSVYLTTISIIQGVALGILATNTFKYIQNMPLTEPWWRFCPYSVMSFVVILAVSDQYTGLLGVFRWSPRIWDTIAPFAIGFSEVAPMFYLTTPKIWWFLTAAFCGFGCLGFINTLCHCKKSMFGKNNKVYHRSINTLKEAILIALISALICILAGHLYSFSVKVLHWYLCEILFFIFLFGMVILLLCRQQRFTDYLHRDFGLVR